MRNEPLDSWPEEPLFCAHCGTTIAADDLFCPRCGQMIGREATSPGWGWYMGLLILAIALFFCILGIGALGAYHGLEERRGLNRGAALTDHRWWLAHSRNGIPLASLQSEELSSRRCTRLRDGIYGPVAVKCRRTIWKVSS